MQRYPESALTDKIILAAIEVHRALGPGLLESAYEACLTREAELQGLSCQRQVSIPVMYKGIELDCAYRVDLIFEQRILIELKACEKILPVHEAQLLTYMKLTGLKVGLILNFNCQLMKNGIKRFVL